MSFFLSVSNWTWIWILCMFWIIALMPCEKGSYLIAENKLYLLENPLVHLISSSCWHFTTHETFHRPTHRNEGPVTDHVSSSPTPSNINIGLGDFLANPIMKLESLLLQCIGLSRAQKITSCKPHIKGKQQPLFFCPIANEHISISHWIASLISCLVCNIITQRSGLQGSQTHSEKNNSWINHQSFSKLCNLYRC